LRERVENVSRESEKRNRVTNRNGQPLNLYQSRGSPVDQILYLQRTIGNRAVTRLIESGTLPADLQVVQRQAAGTAAYTTPAIQGVYQGMLNAGITPTNEQLWALDVLDVQVTGPWKNVTWATVQDEAGQRIFDPNMIHQGTNTPLCGPSVIVHALASQDPVGYATLVKEVFQKAEVNGTRADDDLLNASPLTVMDEADWMVLSCMRDTENWLVDYEGGTITDEGFAGMTMPGEIQEWMETLLKCVETTTYISYACGEVDNVTAVKDLLDRHGNDIIVAMLVDFHYFQNKPQDATANVPSHWVRVLSIPQASAAQIKIEAYDPYDRGSVQIYEFPPLDIEDVLFEFVVGSTRPNLL
jgi:hypothetical protein